MRLPVFIRENTDRIIADWETFARTISTDNSPLTSLRLRDHIMAILAFIADDIDSFQSKTEQVEKSRGEKPHSLNTTAAEVHASSRHDDGYDMDQMVSEYRALRASIVKLWLAQKTGPSDTDVTDLTRFHEAIDQSLTESIRGYTVKLDAARNLFLGILGHDIRNPLGAISMSAQVMLRLGPSGEREKMMLNQIRDSTERANEIVTNLLDLMRSRLGTGLPISRTSIDVGSMGKKIVDEMRSMHPHRQFDIKLQGDLAGDWDQPRLEQVLSNLLSNAVQYGFTGTPITVGIAGLSDRIEMSVHNSGAPIPKEAASRIFDALTRVQVGETGEHNADTQNLGLGLYITKQIIVAHGGTISVTSDETGTVFTTILPRHAPVIPT
ncbi:HAMP domain-containing sensor histidine kinase [Asticcacaulis sp. 201]|uniref:sensor histidine kinase n=1 Tax=Asticcacaulis sp. 201 TaxID=3028787 RepID=UPI00291637E9|nr:HAMP domain-containing sensor histidine kinase [Asticcacaulis sp. 201]MDV6332956.1 HAMP domain-containing sensor histidine kinase [Asticcacaulis sp. 201]